jgi:hypothetical protein
MKRSVKTSATAIIGRGELVLEISQNEFGKWALEFTLLLEGLANSVEMRIGAENRLRIRLTNEPHTDRYL